MKSEFFSLSSSLSYTRLFHRTTSLFLLFCFLIHFPRVISNIDLSVNIFLLPLFSSLLHLIGYFFELRGYSIININQSQHNNTFSWFYYYCRYYSVSLTHTHIPDTLWRSGEIFIESYCFFHHCIWSLWIKYRLFVLFFQVTCTYFAIWARSKGLYFNLLWAKFLLKYFFAFEVICKKNILQTNCC